MDCELLLFCISSEYNTIIYDIIYSAHKRQIQKLISVKHNEREPSNICFSISIVVVLGKGSDPTEGLTLFNELGSVNTLLT
jgi:hypothetical protein